MEIGASRKDLYSCPFCGTHPVNCGGFKIHRVACANVECPIYDVDMTESQWKRNGLSIMRALSHELLNEDSEIGRKDKNHWAIKNPGIADQYRAEAQACRIALGFDPESGEISPYDLRKKIAEVRKNTNSPQFGLLCHSSEVDVVKKYLDGNQADMDPSKFLVFDVIRINNNTIDEKVLLQVKSILEETFDYSEDLSLSLIIGNDIYDITPVVKPVSFDVTKR